MWGSLSYPLLKCMERHLILTLQFLNWHSFIPLHLKNFWGLLACDIVACICHHLIVFVMLSVCYTDRKWRHINSLIWRNFSQIHSFAWSSLFFFNIKLVSSSRKDAFAIFSFYWRTHARFVSYVRKYLCLTVLNFGSRSQSNTISQSQFPVALVFFFRDAFLFIYFSILNCRFTK